MRRRDLVLGVGAALAGRRAARAQSGGPVRRIGVLMSTAENEAHERAAIAAFTGALEALGWVPRRTVAITTRWGFGNTERMAANAREIVASAPDVILVKGANLPPLAPLTRTIPIVFVFLSDATTEHYVKSLARPGGNITGFTSSERDLVTKRLQLLREIAPRTVRALYLRSERVGTDTAGLFRSLAGAAAASGFPVVDGVARTGADIEPLIAAFARQPNGGLITAFDAFNTTHATLIVELAARYRLPAVYSLTLFADAGGLLSYGFDQNEVFREAAAYVDRILKGARPGDLPVQEPTRFQLVLNLKTARALGLTPPPSLLAQADAVIR